MILTFTGAESEFVYIYYYDIHGEVLREKKRAFEKKNRITCRFVTDIDWNGIGRNEKRVS